MAPGNGRRLQHFSQGEGADRRDPPCGLRLERLVLGLDDDEFREQDRGPAAGQSPETEKALAWYSK